MNRSMFMRVYVGFCLFFTFVWMDLAVLKRLDFLQRFLCTECKNMGYFVDEANLKVEGHLWRGITIYHIYRAFTRLVQSRYIRKTPE